MNPEIALSAEGTHAVLTVRQKVTNELASAFAQSMNAFSVEHGVSRFLVDVRGMPYDGTVFTHYEFVVHDLRKEEFDLSLKVAVVASPDDDTHDFLEVVSLNAGYNVRVFKDYAEGARWLVG